MIPNSNYNNQIRTNRNHSSMMYVKKTAESPQTNPSPKVEAVQPGEISPHDLLWQMFKNVGIIDDDGVVTNEAVKGYKLGSLNDIEFKKWFDFVCKPIKANHGIEFSLIEFYAFLFTVAPKVGIRITSTSLFGGAVPALFESYYTRTCDELYKKRCEDQNITPQKDLITDAIVTDFKRKVPDYDFVTGIDGDLKLANSLITKFFAWKLAHVKNLKSYNLKYAVDAAKAFANHLVENSSNNRFFVKTPHPEQENIISQFQSFYHDFFDSKDPIFSLASFGVDCQIDHNFVPSQNVGNTYFLNHALRIPFINQAIELVNIISSNPNQIPEQELLKKLPKITPVHEYKEGLQTVVDRTAKRIRIISEVNDRALGAYLSLITRGYTNQDPDLPVKLLKKIKNDGYLALLKKALENHHSERPLDYIVFGFNALNCLPSTTDHPQKCQLWWEAMMRWYNDKILQLNNATTLAAKEDHSVFFMSLKTVLDSKAIPFSMCRDLLQMYGCLKVSAPNDQEATALKIHLRNPEGQRPEVVISQINDNNNRTISFYLNLHEALESILLLNDAQIDVLTDLIKHLYPKKAYDRKLISSNIFNKKLADRAVDCFKHPHPTIKKLGYELLLLFSISNPEPETWVLKNLIKYLPLTIEDPLTIANLKMALDFTPNNIETDKLISPLKDYCQNYKGDFQSGCFNLCLALANSEQSSTAVSIYSRLKLNANEQKQFLNVILVKEPLEAIMLFSAMQSQKCFSDKEEIEIFIRIAEKIQKNDNKVSHSPQLIALVDCAKKLFQKERVGGVLNPAFESTITIVESLCQYGLITEALKLLGVCSENKITLVNADRDNEIWMLVCEAGLKRTEIDVENLHNIWLKRFSCKPTDREIVLKINTLEAEFSKHLYKKYHDALLTLHTALQESSAENLDKLNNAIENCNTDLLKLLKSPGLIDCTFEFLKEIAGSASIQQQTYTELALNLTLECAKNKEHSEKLVELDDVVKTYLDTVKDSDKECSIRQASLNIAKVLLTQKHPEEAMKWMLRIFRIAMKNNTTKIIETKHFDMKGKSIPLLSFNLPANPVKLLDTIAKMPEKELDVYKMLTEQRTYSNEMIIKLKREQKAYLVKKANECVMHSHPIVQKLGFELLMTCAVTLNETEVEVVEMSLVNDLIVYLPMILASANPALKVKLVGRMNSILKLSSYSKFADDFINLIPTNEEEIKSLYLAYCKALALTKYRPLFEIGKMLIQKQNMTKFAPGLSQQDKIEIIFAYFHGLLPENGMFAFDCLKLFESDLNITSKQIEKRELDIILIKSLIESKDLEQAKEHLTSCVKNKRLLKQELETTQLWVSLFEKFVQESIPNHNMTAKLLMNLLNDGTISKTHSTEMWAELVISLIGHLFELKNDISSGLARKLIIQMKDFNPTDDQKAKLAQSIETYIQSKITKEYFSAGYQDLKNDTCLYLPEGSKLDLRKSFLTAAIDYEFYSAAIEILTVLQIHAEDEVVKDAFDRLLYEFFKPKNGSTIDEERVLQSYQLLKDVELESKQSVRYKYALQWLENAEMHFSPKYKAETMELLKIVLQLVENGYSSEESMISIVKKILAVLNSAELKSQFDLAELKELVFSCHSKIASELQSQNHLDVFCEYLDALHQHQISKKMISTVWPQTCWLADQYLKKGEINPAHLLIIHHLLNAAPHNVSESGMNSEMTVLLATVLLKHKFPQQAMQWIEKLISLAGKDHTLPIIDWCKALLEQNRAKLSVRLLEELEYTKDQPSDKAEIYFKASKSLLENDTVDSAQLLQDNWALLNANCISEADLSDHLKSVIRKLFLCLQEVDLLPLFSSLMLLRDDHDEDFIIEQFNNCCAYINTPQKNVDLDVHAPRVCEFIISLFFKPERILPGHLHLVKILSESRNSNLAPVKISILNNYPKQTFLKSHSSVSNNLTIIALYLSVLEDLDSLQKDSKIDSRELGTLHTFYSKLMKEMPIGESPEKDKKLSIAMLENARYMHFDGLEGVIKHSKTLLGKYPDDLQWMEKATSLIIDMMIVTSMKYNDYGFFFSTFNALMTPFSNTNLIVASRFVTEFIAKSSNLPEGHMRSLMLRLAFTATLDLIERSHPNIKADQISLDGSSVVDTFNKSKKPREIISDLVEKLLFCHPNLALEYSLDFKSAKNVVIEHTSPLDPQKHLLRKRELNELERGHLNIVKDWLPVDDQVKCLGLTNQTFEHYYALLLQNLTKYDFQKYHPNLMLMLQIVSIKTLTKVVNQEKMILTEDSYKVILSNTLSEDPASRVYDAFATIINQYISYEHPATKEKALSMFENIPKFLWKSHLNELTDLLMKVMNCKQLYPKQVERIFNILDSTHVENRELRGWSDISTKICFHFFDMLNRHLNILEEKNRNAFELAFQFFAGAMDQGLIKNTHAEFMHQFKGQMQKIHHMDAIRSKSIVVAQLINASLNNNSKYKKEILDFIRLNYSQIMMLKSKYLNDNVNISLVLCNEGFYDSKTKYESLINKYLDQFEARLKEESDHTIHASFLKAIFPQIQFLEDQMTEDTFISTKARNKDKSSMIMASEDSKRGKLNKIIEEHMNTILPTITHRDVLESNLQVLDLLIKSKYFTGSVDANALIDKYKGDFKESFALYQINGDVSESLITAMRLLFTQKEIDNSISVLNLDFQPDNESPFELSLVSTDANGGEQYEFTLKKDHGL